MYVTETLNKLAQRGRELKQELYMQPFPIHCQSDAEKYLRLGREYHFIANLFSEMQAFGWSDDKFDITQTSQTTLD